jgi:hypothetical protein
MPDFLDSERFGLMRLCFVTVMFCKLVNNFVDAKIYPTALLALRENTSMVIVL